MWGGFFVGTTINKTNNYIQYIHVQVNLIFYFFSKTNTAPEDSPLTFQCLNVEVKPNTC